MSTEYDSAKLRALAAQIGRINGEAEEVKRTTLPRALREMPANFQGAAAGAMEQSVNDLLGDVSSLCLRLEGIRDALNTLADRVDEADRQAKAVIESK